MSSDADLAVQATCNDASMSKRFAVQKGYWKDPFISDMVKSSGNRKPPEINRGYYARTESVWRLVKKFISATKKQCQIVSLGGGLDTMFWRLSEENMSPIRYVELDFSNIIMRKVQTVRSKPLLIKNLDYPENNAKFESTSILSEKYCLLPADLRDLQLVQNQIESSKIDYTVPTLFIAECVLVYMPSSRSNAILKWVSENFETAMFINYEQVNMGDRFGKVMIDNLKSRECDLPGVDVCQSIDTQKDRFVMNGWEEVHCVTMWSAYHYLPQADVQRIEKLEFMDEKELLEQLLTHYCICWATKGGKDIKLDKIELS